MSRDTWTRVRWFVCPDCFGHGRVRNPDFRWVTCPRCGGSGQVEAP